MFEKITKTNIVDNIYENEKYERQDIAIIVDAFLEELKKSLIAGKSIEIRGFGTFEPRLRQAKNNARNPKTGEVLSIEPHHVAAFKPGKELKDKLWDLK